MKHTPKQKQIINMMYGLFSDLGMKKELPEKRSFIAGYLIRAYERLISDNPRFPKDMGDEYTEFLTAKFFTALVQNTATRKGNNLSALCQAFETWYDPSQQNKCKEEFYRRYPHRKPKQLAERSIPTKMEAWSDGTIRAQYRAIMEVFGEDASGLFNTAGAKSYFRRIKAEYEKRGRHDEPVPTCDFLCQIKVNEI